MAIEAIIPKGRRMQSLYRKMHLVSLIGMNYGSGVECKDGDAVAIRRTGPAPMVFDGGANLGQFTERVLAARPNATIHAFEPAPQTFQALLRKFPTGVQLHNFGLSDHEGDATMYADEPTSESASVMPQDRSHWSDHDDFQPIGVVKLRTIDDVCDELGIERIDLLKLDVEGAELRALRGASRMLAEGRIALIQFEYGLPGMAARVYLRDFFKLLDGWRIHRIVSDGVVPLDYHERYEILWTANYLAVPERPTATS